MIDIALEKRYNNATVRFNGVPHLIFKTDLFAGLQTWITADRWCVEITLRTGAVIRTEYDHAEKFKRVLACIEEAIED